MKKVIYIACYLISLTSFAQSNQEYIDRQIKSLESQLDQKGITEYFIYRSFSTGGVYITKLDTTKCIPYPDTIKYLFWKEEGKNWIKRLSECGISSDIQLTGFKPVDFFIQHIDRIEKEEVLRYSYKPDVQVGEKTPMHFITISHSVYRELEFNTQHRSFEKYIDTFKLTNDQDEKNVNYAHNNALPLVKLSNRCKRIINKLEDNGVFETIIRID